LIRFLVDTSILIRLANRTDQFFPTADRAVAELHQRGDTLHITPQNLIEFRNVATRPSAVNGLGMSAVAAAGHATTFEAAFPLLPDTPDIYSAWKALVQALGVIGKRVHDARLAAVCHVHGVTHLLTFNVANFTGLAAFGPGVVVVHPANV
jgi:predicted nucleic acid-binding protein